MMEKMINPETGLFNHIKLRLFVPLILFIIIYISLEIIIRTVNPFSIKIYLDGKKFEDNMKKYNPEGFLVLDNSTGYKHGPNIDHFYYGPDTKFRIKTNSLGFRGMEPSQKKPGEYRILVTGDSYVDGWGVDNHEIFIDHLRVLLNSKVDGINYQVYNFGTIGYGTLEEVKTVIKYYDIIKPDLVILVFFGGNDFTDNMNVRKFYLQDNRVSFKSLGEHERRTCIINNSMLYTYLRLKIKAVQYRLNFQKAIYNTKMYISELAKFSDNKNVKSIFVYFDTVTVQKHWTKEALDNLLGMPPSIKRKEIIKDHCKSMNLPFFDLQDKIADYEKQNSLYDKKHGHWNPEGHRFVAHALSEYLTEHQLVQ